MDLTQEKRFEKLSNLIVYECNLLKKRNKTQEDFKKIKSLRVEQNKIRESIKKIEREYKANYESPLAEYLPDRSREEHLVAEEILNNDVEYKYKSDKVKAFLNAGVGVREIFLILQMREETNVTESYINSIKEKLNN